MEPGERAYGQATAELVFPDLDLLRALAEEPAPRRARVLTFRSTDLPAAFGDASEPGKQESR
jgi:hypothetical protein